MKPVNYLLIIFLLLSFFAVDAYFSSSNEEYSMYNSNWNGTSLFVNDALSGGAVPVTDYDELAGIENSTLIIIEPDGLFSPGELRALRDYKINGNIILISDEKGLSGTLLKLLGTDLSVEKVNLSSVDREYDNPGFIICYTSDEYLMLDKDQMVNEINSIVLNKPSVATGGNDLISTSFMSWVDTNGNERADKSESLGKRSVFVTFENIYLLSDSGIFQNAVYKDVNLKDNRKFIKNMLESSDVVYLDSAHSKIASEEGMLRYLNWIRNNETVKAVAIIIIILLLLSIYRGRYDR